MASHTIQQLLQPPSAAKSEERTLEFINANLWTLTQLEQKDILQRIVADTVRKGDETRSAFRETEAALQECIKNTLSSTRSHLAAAQELSLTRHSLADELALLSSELVSSLNRDQQTKPTLLEELESLHRSLKELESVKGYVSVIERALRLSEAAVAQVSGAMSSSTTDPVSATSLTQYQSLKLLVSSVSSHCSKAENPSQNRLHTATLHDEAQPLKIVIFLMKIRDRTWSNIKELYSSKLVETAEKMGWPQPIDYSAVSSHDHTRFESAFLDLLRLQDLGNEMHASDSHRRQEGIYPIQALISPIVLRFKFHFENKRDTNRMDKPEWYFTHILNVVHVHRPFMDSTVQGLLSTTQHRHVNAFREFVYHLLTPINHKLMHTIPRLLNHPSLLAHTIYQALAFDASLREQDFSLEGTTGEVAVEMTVSDNGNKAWEGVSQRILSKKEWFESWLDGERKFAEDQYNDIISSADAWQIADDIDSAVNSNADTDLRPTNSARRVKALIEQITDRYQPLPRFAARTRFLITIQIPILESYHSRISSSLDAFETLSSSFARVVPGALTGQVGHGPDTRKLTSGVEGVGRLVKAGISAHYIAVTMERWGEDLFFLELWSEINARAALRVKAETHPLLPNPLSENISTPKDAEALPKGTIFQELVAQYLSLEERAEDMIVCQVCSEVESTSKAYFLSQLDSSNHEPLDREDVSIPTILATPISLLSSHLAFLSQSLPSSFVTMLYRRIASTLATSILQRRVLQRGIGRLSVAAAKHIAEECLLWVEACRVTIGRSVRSVEGPWVRLLDAMKLLTLDQDKFRLAVDRIFETQSIGMEKLLEELELADWDIKDLVGIVRLRVDCWR